MTRDCARSRLVRRLLQPAARYPMNRIALLPLVLSFAACMSSSKPTREQYDDTAQAIASTTSTGGGGGDVGSMTDSVTIAQGTMPTGFTLMGDGHFQGTHLGLDYSYNIVCKSAAGVVSACNATTDQASVDVAWSGNLATTYVDAS